MNENSVVLMEFVLIIVLNYFFFFFIRSKMNNFNLLTVTESTSMIVKLSTMSFTTVLRAETTING